MSLNLDVSTWRRQTAGGIKYKLVEGFPRGSFERNDDSSEFTATEEEEYIIQADAKKYSLGEPKELRDIPLLKIDWPSSNLWRCLHSWP